MKSKASPVQYPHHIVRLMYYRRPHTLMPNFQLATVEAKMSFLNLLHNKFVARGE